MDYLIKNADVADFDTLKTRTRDILISNGRFSKIADHIEESADVTVIDADHKLAMPGFVDAHTHMAQSFIKGPLDDVPITEWLIRLFAIDAKMDSEIYYYATLLGCLQSLRFGTTCINEMGDLARIDEQLRAFEDAGIRTTYGVSTTDVPENDATPIYSLEESLRIHQKVYDRVHGKNNGLIKASVAPAGLPAVSKKLAKACKKFADEHGILYHTHLGEGKTETENVAKTYGLNGEGEALYEIDVLDANVLLAHSIWISDKEIDLIKEKGAIPVYCPNTNLKISDGIPKIAQMIEKGIDVCLGCDGEASSSNRDMIREARIGAYLQKGATLVPTVLDASTVFKMMTINGAKALGYDDLGLIKEGYLADLILVDTSNELSMTDIEHRVSNLLYCGDGHMVDTVFVNGEMKVKNKKLVDFDEKEIIARCSELISRLNRETGNA
ncbi:MAG: amidohydrolase [Erysipelotrichaceae bacterium]|nr:amidohydrolase [Erysipelotrichaceae bacterium]